MVYQIGGLAAPMLAIRSVSMALAGTDFQHHRHFITAAESYRRVIQQTMNGDIMAHPTKTAYLAGSDLWSQVPEFEYEAPAASWAMDNLRGSIAVLGLWLLVATAWMSRPLATSAL
jgi:ABC-2 type transport system permease protein